MGDQRESEGIICSLSLPLWNLLLEHDFKIKILNLLYAYLGKNENIKAGHKYRTGCDVRHLKS